jgi:hypothetical protein
MLMKERGAGMSDGIYAQHYSLAAYFFFRDLNAIQLVAKN